MADNWLLIKKRIEYFFKAQGNHYLHSPFVFNLYNDVLSNTQQVNDIELVRCKLLKLKNVVNVTDFGAGSNNKSNKRRLNEIVKNAAVTPKFGGLLNKLVSHYNCKNVLELGTNIGIGSAYLAYGNDAQIVTVEGCPNLREIAQSNFKELGLTNVKIINHEFGAGLPMALASLNHKVDLAYLDGNHQYAPTIEYYNKIVTCLHENSVVVLDDIFWSYEMMKAWNELKAKSEVSVSINLYRMGLLFFKSDISKQHFTLRF